ncbi:MAG TPA: PfkB family carbohydrate kinase [Anaerolineales bacterium]|nr:PfkB family carbohydrate kinase [Anaerolineales bacterium]
MNENEARGLFGSPDAVAANSGQVVFVTLGERGAFTVRGDGVVLRAPALPAAEFDPTGAGDSFCGAALAVLVRGGGLDEALEAGTALAARTIEGLGPSNLLP